MPEISTQKINTYLYPKKLGIFVATQHLLTDFSDSDIVYNLGITVVCT